MSSKKPVDHIEERIKLAAENSIMPFDEKAWEAMEAKLDGDNKRRRPLLWWLILPVIVGSGIWGAYKWNDSASGNNTPAETAAAKPNEEKQSAGDNKESNTKPVSPANTTTIPSQQPAPGDKKVVNDANKPVASIADNSTTATTGNTNADNNTVAPANTKNVKTANSKKGTKRNANNVSSEVDEAQGSVSLAKHNVIRKNGKGKMVSAISGGNEEATAEPVDNNKDGNAVVKDAPTPVKEEVLSTAPVKEQKDLAAQQAVAQSTTDNKKEEVKEKEKKEIKKEKKDKRQSKGLYALAAIGSDAGSTKLFSYTNSKITPRYGFGVGYQLNNRFSIQSGFYVTNMKYVAGKDDYAAKQTPYWQYLTRVKAACLIYEIPLSIRTNLVQKKSLSVFGTIGVSSYIMKKEDYDYVYEYNSMEHTYPYQYRGNKHLFSVMALSAGIEKKISGKFSLLAESSFGIPLRGVGDGRVKLYSSSLMAGIKYNFFKTK